MTEVTKDVEIARLVTPKFLSIVGKPANQVAFKVIRNDNGETTMTAPHIQRKRATKRSDPLVSVTFGLAETDDAIKQTMADWGVTEFSVEVTADSKVVRCSDAGDAETISITLGGAVATILKPISQTADTVRRGVAVASIEFASDYFPEVADISAWCASHNVDFSEVAVQNGTQHSVVRRDVSLEAGAETRKVQVDAGVQFVVARADANDVPPEFIAIVNDAAYGNWGWGQLDFAATMADVEFCDVSQEATYTLNRVIDRILFYSDLPIALRKELIVSATSQFSEFIVTLMDALPARVVVANRSTSDKEKSMSKAKGQDGKTVERQDTPTDDKAGTTPVTAPADAAADASISRTDVEKMIGDAVSGLSTQIADLSAKLAPAATQRSDEAGAGEVKDEKSAPSEDATGETLQAVLRSVKELGDSVKTVVDRVQSLEGSTTVRSDSSDGEGKPTQRKDVFKGMFGAAK